MANPYGNYYILSLADTTMSVDVWGQNVKDGTNITVFKVNWTRAQIWWIADRGNGYQVLSTWLGKSLDVAGGRTKDGTNVQLYRDNGTRAQRWNFTDTGTTANVNGTNYPVYTITNTGSGKLLTAAGTSSHSNITIYGNNGSNLQKWVLVPVPTFRSGGLYEIVPLVSTNMRIDVRGNGVANGTNVYIYSANGTNAQKFVLTDEGNGWSIRHVGSGKYIDVYYGKVSTPKTNVQIYEDNDTRAQRWALHEWGQIVINGTTCKVVSFGAGNALNTMMDVYCGGTSLRTNVWTFGFNDTLAQKFALLPTSATDPTMPVPRIQGLATSVGANGYQYCALRQGDTFTYHPTWTCSDAWATSGANSYQVRYRTRKMKSSNSAWESWSAWTSWRTASVTQTGNRVWLTNGIKYAYDIANYKHYQVQFQARSQGVSSLDNLVSETSEMIMSVLPVPTANIISATWTPEGIRFGYTHNYPYGALTYNVKSVQVNGHNVLVKPCTAKGYDMSDTFVVPQSVLNYMPKNSETPTVKITYKIGNDQWGEYNVPAQGQATMAFEAGTVDVTPTITDGQGATLRATVARTNTVRMWIHYDGKLYEQTGVVRGNETVFNVIYPFEKEFNIYTTYVNADNSEWGADVMQMRGKKSIGHVFNWGIDGFCVLWLNKSEALHAALDFGVTAERHNLLGRSNPHTTYLKDAKGDNVLDVSGTAEGYIVPQAEKYGTTVDSVEALVKSGDAFYRSPTGRMCNVAVTGGSIDTQKDVTQVKITFNEQG